LSSILEPPPPTGAGCFAQVGNQEDLIAEQRRQIDALEKKIFSVETDLGLERALRMEMEEELEKADEAEEKAANDAEEREGRWKQAHQEWLVARDTMVRRFKETSAAWEVESARAAAKLAETEKQLASARGKVVQLERELAGANAQVLEAKRGQLAAVRAAKASEAAHKGSLQSKQWDRGKRVHKQ
jgi:chromosome segregation ATPase